MLKKGHFLAFTLILFFGLFSLGPQKAWAAQQRDVNQIASECDTANPDNDMQLPINQQYQTNRQNFYGNLFTASRPWAAAQTADIIPSVNNCVKNVLQAVQPLMDMFDVLGNLSDPNMLLQVVMDFAKKQIMKIILQVINQVCQAVLQEVNNIVSQIRNVGICLPIPPLNFNLQVPNFNLPCLGSGNTKITLGNVANYTRMYQTTPFLYSQFQLQ